MTIISNFLDSQDKRPLIIVAGFGAAGAAAAVAAAQAGGRVLVCDRAPKAERGGNTRENLLYMAMKNTDEPNEEFVSMLDRIASPWSTNWAKSNESAKHWSLDPGFKATWLKESAPAVNWLQSLGFSFRNEESDLVDDGFAPGLIPIGGGDALLDRMEKIASELHVEFAYDAAIVDVERDGSGKVTAAVIETATGRQTLQCSAVILATGGIQGNYDMLTKYLGTTASHAVPITRYGYHCKGEGVQIALNNGAAAVGDLGDWHGVAVDARADGERWILSGMELGIMVNRDGKRFFDEATGEPADKAIRDQPGGIAYYIADASALRHPFANRRFATGMEPLKANSIEELAEVLGVPESELRSTIEEYHRACPSDPSKGTQGLVIEKRFGAKPLEEMPFVAWPLRATICFTMGGIKSDSDGRVLTDTNYPIEGLYVAGDTAGGYYHGYINYTASLKAIVFGRRAAAHAVQLSSAQ